MSSSSFGARGGRDYMGFALQAVTARQKCPQQITTPPPLVWWWCFQKVQQCWPQGILFNACIEKWCELSDVKNVSISVSHSIGGTVCPKRQGKHSVVRQQLKRGHISKKNFCDIHLYTLGTKIFQIFDFSIRIFVKFLVI